MADAVGFARRPRARARARRTGGAREEGAGGPPYRGVTWQREAPLGSKGVGLGGGTDAWPMESSEGAQPRAPRCRAGAGSVACWTVAPELDRSLVSAPHPQTPTIFPLQAPKGSLKSLSCRCSAPSCSSLAQNAPRPMPQDCLP